MKQYNNTTIKTLFIVYIACLGMFILGVPIFFLFFFMHTQVNDSNTTKFNATVYNINSIDLFKIRVHGHNARLIIFGNQTVVDANALNDIEEGHNILFGIRNRNVRTLGDVNAVVELVKLISNDSTIISIESFNSYMREKRLRAITDVSIMGGVLLIIGVVFIALHMRQIREEEL